MRLIFITALYCLCAVRTLGWECNGSWCNTQKVGFGILGGMHKTENATNANHLGGYISIDIKVWHKWLYAGFKPFITLSYADIDNNTQNSLNPSSKNGSASSIEGYFNIGLPLSSISSPHQIFTYISLGVSETDYSYNTALPGRTLRIVGVGISGIAPFGDLWNLEYALEYGHLFNSYYAFSKTPLALLNKVKIGNNSHEARFYIGLAQKQDYGFYTRLTLIYRAIDSALINANTIYPSGFQTIGFLEMGIGFSLDTSIF